MAFDIPMAFATPLDAAADLADLRSIRDFVLGGDNRRALEKQGLSCYLLDQHVGRRYGTTVYGPASLIVKGAQLVAFCRIRRVDYVEVQSVDEFIMVHDVLMAFGTPSWGHPTRSPERPAPSHIYVDGSKYKIRPKTPSS